MKEVVCIEAKDIAIECPYCKEELRGFLRDPRGIEIECDFYFKIFKVHHDADIELY